MTKVEITTKAIEQIINDPTKLKEFTIRGKRIYANDDEYFDYFADCCSTLAKLSPENQEKFKCFLSLCANGRNESADFGYLCEIIAYTEEFKNFNFKVNPILELYEKLLRENWSKVKRERNVLDEIGATDRTPKSNMDICKAIGNFLKEYIITKVDIASI